ncbi:MAG: uroporphyrinogen-III synthase [Pseudomonadota bacterium]|nr:uroporphyrinogen-III synthase [Pseudomonadota bacterium]MDP1902755.1 uroporphyrinogen-III synthase [Pseudomonadota bacterium]MDP2350989.1 uroporphyrinogen-III synthase [Pseudomonadota bacterium]
MNLPLSGLGVLITRPLEQAAGLRSRLEALGARPVLFPTLAILPPTDAAALAPRLAALAEYDLAIFISPTAARHGLGLIPAWPRGLRAAAVGPGTLAALREAGVAPVLAPSAGADSEQLLALPELADLSGRRVLIFRGEGGRELLAETLAARGAEVDYAECYRRGLPASDPGNLLDEWRRGGIQAVTVLSSQGLDNLFTLLGADNAELIRATPLFAPHTRIAEHARALGLSRAIATPPGEAGLARALVEYFAHV